MVRLDAVFTAAEGLTPDIAAKLSQHASRYQCNIMLECGQKKIRLDSLIGILSVEFRHGLPVIVVAEGADEKAAAEDIREVLAGK